MAAFNSPHHRADHGAALYGVGRDGSRTTEPPPPEPPLPVPPDDQTHGEPPPIRHPSKALGRRGLYQM
jgi:hypothetical protein